ncbi:TRAP transporter small permease subunit [Desulforhopalus singaporensis]|uniref:TRAP-type mannitol/chloroaromatic compound transport system, small permease component n=1 Tax=Desulforhopalus singaporensis TaxID=91360 RepID=A0A1H0TEC2_9BACT|nr:TRAP transporter small permease subunit [Desulforhopalus singaporensis]SDP51938.1 TRAP-type mannitol/chloroaromatic compound transport system, small permease component [Desulforhopalus singaporensis]
MQTIEKLISIAEKTNKMVGKASSLLIFVFMFLMVYEVIARYFFESPTIWVHELCGYLFAAYVAFTGGWVLLRKGHVSVDIIYQFFPKKLKYSADLIVSVVALFMFVVLFWQGYKFAWHAFATNQHSHTLFGPVLWPVKALLPLGSLFFVLQILADLGKTILKFKQGSV